MPKPRVVLVNQYCYPDVASTGHLIHILAHELHQSHGFEVEVLTTQPSYGDKSTWVRLPPVQIEDGVKFRRVWVPRLDKNNIVGRVIKELMFLIQVTLRAFLMKQRNTVFVYTTAPPYGGLIGAISNLIRRQTYCTLLYDSYPHIGVWVGTFKKNGFIERVWHRFNRFMYARAKKKIVLCRDASKLLQEDYRVPEADIVQIPNWADGDKIYPISKHNSNFAKENALTEPFTVLYSGNMGLYYEFDTILKVAELLQDAPFKLVLVGGGGKKAWCEQQIAERKLTNSIVLPYQPFETLNDSLNACDASLVTIARGIEGISFPSKLYTSLATGKAIIAISEPHSELREIVDKSGCGVWAELGDAEGLRDLIVTMMNDPDRTAKMGEEARALFERDYTREACSAKYAQVIRDAGRASGVYAKDA